MTTVLLVVHLMVVIALVAVVLLQRSEGGALGIGGGGGFMTSRGSANVLTRATAILAAVFFLTSMSLSILPRYFGGPTSILDTVPGGAPISGDAPIGSGSGGLLDELNRMSPGAQTPTLPSPGAQSPATPDPAPAPAAGTPAAPAPTAPAPTAPAQ